MFNPPSRQLPQLARAIRPLRTALALGSSALALIGCGGGSDDAPPPPPAPTLAAPTNFTYADFGFRWDATPGATRYELYVDPDGPGPLPESKEPDASGDNWKGFRFNAYPEGSQRLIGSFYDDNLATTINATYRLRACDAQGCGTFTAPIVKEYSYEFPSGRVPISHSQSKDGLTLASVDSYVSHVFTRSSLAHPWQQQAVLPYGFPLALSDDGNTLAITERVPSEGTAPDNIRTHIYQRSGSTWSQQASLDNSNPRADCLLQPCGVRSGDYHNYQTLSADGNVLAQSIHIYSPATGKAMAAVVIHARNGTTWSRQALLEIGERGAELMALARDGKTLVVNQGARYLSDDYTHPLSSFALVFTQQSNGTWSQQARIPVGLRYQPAGISSGSYSDMQLSDDGNTLAVMALDTSGRAIQDADLSCGPLKDGYYMALFTRNGTAWQRQAAISRGYESSALWRGGEKRSRWALARDGNALLYGNELFTRNNGTWVCPS